MLILFVVLVFMTVGLAVAGWLFHRGGAGTRAIQQRLQRFATRGADLPRTRVERDSRLSSIPLFDTLLRSIDVGPRLELLLYRAGMSMRAGMLVLLVAVFAAAGYLAGMVWTQRVGPSLLFLAVMAPMPYFYVSYRKQQRMKAFAQEFPDALDLLVSALRAGLSFSAAMQIVGEESPEPVRGEFAIAVEEQALGLDFRETLTNLTRRVDSLDLRFFVTAVVLQRETGGNLAEILDNTAKLIRDRFRILGDIQTFTAQGRLTGIILTLLPVSIGLFTFLMTPDYFRPMLESPGGRFALWFAAGMQLLGVLAIRKIVNIKV